MEYMYMFEWVCCCAADIDECANNPCVHGTCTDGIDSYTCACDDGYDGNNCNSQSTIVLLLYR